MAAALGPLACLAAVLGPLAYNLTKKNKGTEGGSGGGVV